MAIGLLQACRERGVRVPRTSRWSGWDDVPYASLVTPPLTTVRVPRYELGKTAARRLLDLIAGRPAGAGPPPLALELGAELGHRAEAVPSPPTGVDQQSKEERGERAGGRRACA